MQKRSEKRIRGAMMALAATAVLLLGFSTQGMALDLMQVLKPKMQKVNVNASKLTLNNELMKLNVPVNVSKMPAQWQQATLEISGLVLFLDNAGERVGAGFQDDDNYHRDVALLNGSYNGTVTFSLNILHGSVTDNTCGLGAVVAKVGNEEMLLGVSSGGTPAASGFCTALANDLYEALKAKSENDVQQLQQEQQ